ncbi:MAG TPA: sigma-70 family RNA polymerase sigma factor [Xanthomonadales bacterium]|nr:sigma-70 family RNA polymerase sigma factor [Xanthomonadales bacterium]
MHSKGQKSTDLELLSRIRHGDRVAFSELYRRFHPRIFGYLLRFLSDRATVEEVLDDVMFVVWKDARKFRGKSAVSTWIFGIAYNKIMTAIGKHRRHQSHLDRKAEVDSLIVQGKRHSEWIRAGLAQLSHEHRQVLELTYYGGFSYQEIAEIAGCPVNTVKTRMFHARRRLRILLPALAGQTGEKNRERS